MREFRKMPVCKGIWGECLEMGVGLVLACTGECRGVKGNSGRKKWRMILT